MQHAAVGILWRRKQVGESDIVIEISHLQNARVLSKQIDALKEEQAGEEGQHVDQQADQQKEYGYGGGGIELVDLLPDRVHAQMSPEQGVVADLELQAGNPHGVVPVALRLIGRALGVPGAAGLIALQDAVQGQRPVDVGGELLVLRQGGVPVRFTVLRRRAAIVSAAVQIGLGNARQRRHGNRLVLGRLTALGGAVRAAAVQGGDVRPDPVQLLVPVQSPVEFVTYGLALAVGDLVQGREICIRKHGQGVEESVAVRAGRRKVDLRRHLKIVDAVFHALILAEELPQDIILIRVENRPAGLLHRVGQARRVLQPAAGEGLAPGVRMHVRCVRIGRQRHVRNPPPDDDLTPARRGGAAAGGKPVQVDDDTGGLIGRLRIYGPVVGVLLHHNLRIAADVVVLAG